MKCRNDNRVETTVGIVLYVAFGNMVKASIVSKYVVEEYPINQPKSHLCGENFRGCRTP